MNEPSVTDSGVEVRLQGSPMKWMLFSGLYIFAFFSPFVWLLNIKEHIDPILVIGTMFVFSLGSVVFGVSLSLFTKTTVKEEGIDTFITDFDHTIRQFGVLSQKDITTKWSNLSRVFPLPLIPICLVWRSKEVKPLLCPKLWVIEDKDSFKKDMKLLFDRIALGDRCNEAVISFFNMYGIEASVNRQ